MSATRTRAKAEDTSPQPPQSTPVAPVQHGFQDHSFTLQAIMELQKSVGEMNANLQATKASVDGVKGKVEDLVKWKNMILGGAAAVGVVITILVWAGSKVSDYVTLKAPAPGVTAAPLAAQPVSPAQPAKK
jgi:hypothetical protein